MTKTNTQQPAGTQFCFAVAGGGTAGHIEPALAVADQLQQFAQTKVICLGTSRGLETQLVPARGHTLVQIPPVPVPRKLTPALAKLPFKVVQAVLQTRKVLKEHQVKAVIGFGGYVSAPAYLAAKSLRLPFWVHEANARAGMANKLGVALGGQGLLAVPDCGLKGEVVGIPLRQLTSTDPQQQEELRRRARALWQLEENRPTLLVTGGSQGARAINKALATAAPLLVAAGLQIVHAVGKNNELPEAFPGYHPVKYIDEMAAALAIADLAVARSGAMTVAEFSQAGLPAIYIPLPHGNGEQALNAKSVVAAGGAQYLPESELTGEVLAETITNLQRDGGIAAMKQVLASVAVQNPAQLIAQRMMGRVAASTN